MTNLEWLKKNLLEEEKENEEFCCTIYKKLSGKSCYCTTCNDCYFNKYENILNFLLSEHKEPIKLKQWEYDLMWGLEEGSKFHDWGSLCYMKRKGYFKGVKDTSMSIQYILKNCEVIE